MMQAKHSEIDQVNSFDSNDEREKENCSLFLGDLSIFCDEKDIEEAFAPYGNIVDVRIQRSKETSRALSYGFIEFSCPDSAAAALSEMNYFLLKGRPLRIRWAASRTNPIKSTATPHDSAATVYVRFLTQAADVVVSEESLRSVFNNYGPVFDCAIKKLSHDQKANRTKGYAFISYDSGVLIQGCVDVAGVDAAYRACNDLRNRVVCNVRYRCEFGNRLQKQYGTAVPPAALPVLSVPVPVAVPPMLPPLPLSSLPPPISTAYLPPQHQQYAGSHGVTPVSYTVPHSTPIAGSCYQVQQQHSQCGSDVHQAPQAQYAQISYAPYQQHQQQGYASPTFPLSARSTGSMDGSPAHYQQMQQRSHPAATPVAVQQHNGYASAPASGPSGYSSPPPSAPLTSACLLQSPQQHHQFQGAHHQHHSQQQQNLQTAYQCQIEAQARAQAQLQAQQQQGYGYSQYTQYNHQHHQYQQYYTATPSHMYGANSNGGTPTHASTVHTVTPTNYNNNSSGGMMMPVMMVPVQMSMTPGGQMVYSQQMAHHGERPQQQYLPPQTFQQGTNGKAFTGPVTPLSCSQYFAERGLTLSVSTQSTDEHVIHGVAPISLSSSSTSMLPPQQQQGHHGGNSRETTPRSMYMHRNGGGGGGGGNNRSNPSSRRNLHQQQQSCYSSSNNLTCSLQSQSGHLQSGYGDQHALSGEVRKPASRRGSNDSIGTINMFVGSASIDECAAADGDGDGVAASVDAAGISVDVEAAATPAEPADVEVPTPTSTMA